MNKACFHYYLLLTIAAVDSKQLMPFDSSVPVVVENVPFTKIGTYRGSADDGTEYQKSYYFPRYSPKFPMYLARTICQSYKFELATFETRSEMEAVFSMTDNILKASPGSEIFVDAMTFTLKSLTDWYWTKTGKKVAFALPWIPGEPNNSNNSNESCLTFGKRSASASTGFNDAPCTSTAYTFLCQNTEFSIPVKTNKMSKNK